MTALIVFIICTIIMISCFAVAITEIELNRRMERQTIEKFNRAIAVIDNRTGADR